MRLSLTKTLLCACAALAIGSAPVIADDKNDDERLDNAWQAAIGDQEPVLSEKQFALLNNVAFQAAVTKICSGYTLDADKFAKAVADATTPAPANMSDDDAEAWKTAVLIRFGTTYGLLLAEGNDDEDDFCANAKELRDDKDIPNIWK